MAFNINQYLDEINKNIDEINSNYRSDIDKRNNTIIDELKNDYSNLKNTVNKPNNAHAAYNLIAIITYKLDSIQGILIGLEISKQTAATTELTTNITNANVSLKQAQEELKKQIDEKAAAEKAAEDLKNEITSLAENAKTQEETIANFNDTLRKNDAELSRLQDELNNRGDATAMSQRELDEYKAKEAQLLEEKAAIENKINSYNDSITSNKTELETKQAVLNALTSDIANATAMVDEKKQELMNTKAETDLLIKEIKVATEKNDKLKEKLQEQQEEYSELIKKTVALGVNIADLTGQINAAELLKKENEKNKLAAQEELENINKQKEQAETELAEINNQKEEAEKKLKELQDEITNLEGKKSGLENGINKLEDQIYKLIEQKKSLKYQTDTLTANNELLLGKIKDVDTQMAELQKELDNKKTDLENVDKDLLAKKAENKNLSETNTNLQEQIETGKQFYKDSVLKAMNTIAGYNDIITDLQSQTADLEKEKDALAKELQTNKEQIQISKNVIGELEQQQKDLNNTNEALKKQQEELEESNNAANKELLNTSAAIKTNKEIIEGQLKAIGEQEQIITKQKLQIDKLNQEIYGLEQSRDSLTQILNATSLELITAQEKINEIQGNLANKENELAAKKKELEEIEGREKALSENEANLLQRTENVEEREKIQADKDTLLAEIERMNAENNTLQENNQSISEKIDKDETLISELYEKVKNYEDLLQEKQDEYERSIAELKKQQLVEAKLEFELLLNNVDTMKADYDKNVNERTWGKFIASKITNLDQGLKEYIDSIGTLIDLSENNKYFNYLTTSIGLDSLEDVENINRYREYEDIYKNPPPEIPLPQEEEQSTQEQSIDKLLTPSPSPRTDLPQVKHDEIPQISDTEKSDLIKTYVNNPPKNIGDNLLLELYSYAYNNRNVSKMKTFIINTEKQVISICKTNIIHYIKTHHESNSEYKYLITKYLNTNNTNITDKNIRKSLAEISGSTQNKSDYEEFMTHTASRILLHYVNVAGGNKTKRNTKQNKKTRRNTK